MNLATRAAVLPIRHKQPVLSDERPDQILMFALVVVICFGPVAFGVVQPGSLFVFHVCAAALFVGWSVKQVRLGRAEVPATPLMRPVALFAAIVAVQVVFARSAYLHDTELEALNFCSYGVLMLVADSALRSERGLKRFANLLIGFGSVMAVFALVQAFGGNGKIYWVVQIPVRASSFGTYVNRNHYAGLMEMLFPFALVFAVMRFFRIELRILYGSAALMMAVSIVLSRSRGGTASLLLELLLLSFLGVRREHRRAVLTAVAILVAVGAGLAIWLGDKGVVDRLLELTHPFDSNISGHRLDVIRDSLAMIRQKPLLGWGLGTFATVYPRFRSFFSDYFMNAAHNDYVQMVVETGILGLAAMVWFALALFRHAREASFAWETEPSAAVRMAALLACTGLFLHSWTDFNLQIPANAALFFTVSVIAAPGDLPIEERRFVSGTV